MNKISDEDPEEKKTDLVIDTEKDAEENKHRTEIWMEKENMKDLNRKIGI
jgi:hypothetical protein